MKKYFVHETAIIDAGASVGADCKIWHFSHVMPKARIGERCMLGQNVFIGDDVYLGNDVKVQNNVSLYTGVHCEDSVFIGPSCVFTNVINPRSAVARKEEFKKTRIEQGATLGANATIICGVTIGKFAFIGAGSVITKSVADYALVMGNPGKQKGWMSEYGHKLEFDQNGLAKCEGSGEQYEIIDHQVRKSKT